METLSIKSIGYMSRVDNWSAPRREEQKTRIYSHID